MVRALHRAGIEVILDVVFNHSAETDELGPTISFRGIDNRSYYRLPPDAPELYENYSGCGNTLNLAQPRVLQLVMDALRYWVSEMHVDGFRFDLAVALTRDSGFLAAVRQDPLLAPIKLIAEPWDLGPDGYRLGRFPPGWSEWNDRFRDDVRAFWLTGETGIGALAQRLAGSSERFAECGRTTSAGVNYLTAHDGFTLRDLVSYNEKHNELNGENNHDGTAHNLSWNCGVEGPSDDPLVVQRRHRLQRALLATLFVAQGVPMLQGGDELGRTQSGNNNAYCQDNVLTWTDWAQADSASIAFTAGLVALRRRFPQLRRSAWLSGQTNELGQRDVIWWHADGREMTGDDWHGPRQGTLGFLLAPTDGAANPPQTLLVLINREPETQSFVLPPGIWQQLCDSSADAPFAPLPRQDSSPVAARSVQLLAQTL
jgi:glycogen operon protein